MILATMPMHGWDAMDTTPILHIQTNSISFLYYSWGSSGRLVFTWLPISCTQCACTPCIRQQWRHEWITALLLAPLHTEPLPSDTCASQEMRSYNDALDTNNKKGSSVTSNNGQSSSDTAGQNRSVSPSPWANGSWARLLDDSSRYHRILAACN